VPATTYSSSEGEAVYDHYHLDRLLPAPDSDRTQNGIPGFRSHSDEIPPGFSLLNNSPRNRSAGRSYFYNSGLQVYQEGMQEFP
jgi:hypothetical protein